MAIYYVDYACMEVTADSEDEAVKIAEKRTDKPEIVSVELKDI